MNDEINKTESQYTKYIKLLAKKLKTSEFISAKRLDKLLGETRGGVTLGIDGNAAYALLGADLQSGEVVFEVIQTPSDEPYYIADVKSSTVKALRKLTARCYPDGLYSLPYHTTYHPYL